MNLFKGNLCWSMPCMNGGSCFGSAYTYLCICPIGYNGALCERQFGRKICIFCVKLLFFIDQVFVKKIHAVIEVYVLKRV